LVTSRDAGGVHTETGTVYSELPPYRRHSNGLPGLRFRNGQQISQVFTPRAKYNTTWPMIYSTALLSTSISPARNNGLSNIGPRAVIKERRSRGRGGMAYAADLTCLSARRETGDAELLKFGETLTGDPEPSLKQFFRKV
jgi:hypothetical protein